MSDGKKAGESTESYVERLIREAQEEGAFDRLAGSGKPLPPLHPEEEAWWIKRKVRSEQLAVLPDALAIRAEADAVLASLAKVADEQVVRARLQELNARIRKLNATSVSGPPTTVAPLDVEAVVRRWRAARAR
jgi:Domain of unknown function (DUF1992)